MRFNSRFIALALVWLTICLSVIIYARMVGENARRGQFRAFVTNLNKTGATLTDIRLESRWIKEVDFSAAAVTTSKIETCLASSGVYKIESVYVSREVSDLELTELKQSFGGMVARFLRRG